MRVAAFDLGSNSFHLLVVDASADGHFVPLARDKEILRLGDMVSREGRITEAGAGQGHRHHPAVQDPGRRPGRIEIMACATSAIRDADNGGEVIDAIYAATGVRVGLLSGLEEARLIFQAVRASVVIDPGPALCLDLGGGSLEVMVGGPEGLLRAATLPLGVGRLTTELVRDDPPSADDARRLRERLTATLAPVAEEMASLRPTMTVATSGTLSDLARMAVARRTGAVPASLNQVTVSREELEALHADIMASTLAQRTKMAGLDARRADQIPAGSMVAVVAMELFGIAELTMSAWALREGIVLEVIGRADPALWTSDAHAIRRSSVLGLARRCNWDEAHSRHVARLALALFDATADAPRLRRRRAGAARARRPPARHRQPRGPRVPPQAHRLPDPARQAAGLRPGGGRRPRLPGPVPPAGRAQAVPRAVQHPRARGPGPGHQAGRPPAHRRRPRPRATPARSPASTSTSTSHGCGSTWPAPATCRWSCGAPAASASCSRRSSAGAWSSPPPQPSRKAG